MNNVLIVGSFVDGQNGTVALMRSLLDTVPNVFIVYSTFNNYNFSKIPINLDNVIVVDDPGEDKEPWPNKNFTRQKILIKAGIAKFPGDVNILKMRSDHVINSKRIKRIFNLSVEKPNIFWHSAAYKLLPCVDDKLFFGTKSHLMHLWNTECNIDDSYSRSVSFPERRVFELFLASKGITKFDNACLSFFKHRYAPFYGINSSRFQYNFKMKSFLFYVNLKLRYV